MDPTQHYPYACDCFFSSLKCSTLGATCLLCGYAASCLTVYGTYNNEFLSHTGIAKVATQMLCKVWRNSEISLETEHSAEVYLSP